jgi:seryl-tRNA synthetase
MKHNRIEIKLEEELLEIAVGTVRDQLIYIDDNIEHVSINGVAVQLTFSSVPENIESIITDVKDICIRTNKSFRKVKEKVLFKNIGSGTNIDNPHGELKALKSIHEHQRGIYSYSGIFLSLVSGFDEYFLDYAKSIGASESIYPSTLPLKNLQASGYVSNFPHHTLFVSGANKSKNEISLLATSKNISSKQMSDPELVLSPTVCYRCFDVLSNTNIKSDLELYTATCECFRNEGIASQDISRLTNFRMREIVFIGTPPNIEKTRQRICAHARDAIDEFDLSASLVTAFDPFFTTANDKKRGYQNMMGLKYEMRMKIPYLNAEISCMSFNNHQKTLIEAYNISPNRDLASGCVGYGLERLALAVFAQHGLNPQNWPISLKSILN